MTSLDGRARADGAPPPPGAPPVDDPERPAGLRAVPDPVDTGTPDPTTSGTATSVSATEAGTVRRSRPPRPSVTGGVPTPPGPAPAIPPPPAPAPSGAGPAQPPRRPVPPTFSSPGQPPPGVARRDGRHARPDRSGNELHTPPSGYRPRHAAPDAETESFAAVPVTGPGGVGPATLAPAVPTRPAPDPDDVPPRIDDGKKPLYGFDPTDDMPPGERVRIVLAERRVPTRAVRTVAEIEQQTETGELLLGNLLRAQLTLGLRLGLVAVFVLGALPVLFLVLPSLGTVDVAGLRLPWLLLGLAPYPFMLVLAWVYTRAAEHNELDFADNVED